MSDQITKPIIIIPPDTMSAENIAKLNDNGVCVVEAKDPSLVKFLDPIPAAAGRTHVENAAIALSRKILSNSYWANESTQANVSKTFVQLLVKGTRLDPEPSREEQERKFFDQAKRDELTRLAHEEAREERKAAREAKKGSASKPSKSE